MANWDQLTFERGLGSRKRKNSSTAETTKMGEVVVNSSSDGQTSTNHHNVKPLNTDLKLKRPLSWLNDTVTSISGSHGLPLFPILARLPHHNPFVGNFAYSPSTAGVSFSVMFGPDNSIITEKEMFRLHRIKAHPLTGTFHSRPGHYSKLHGLYKFTVNSIEQGRLALARERRAIPPRALSRIRAGFAKQQSILSWDSSTSGHHVEEITAVSKNDDNNNCIHPSLFPSNKGIDNIEETVAVHDVTLTHHSAEQSSTILNKGGGAVGMSPSVNNSKTETAVEDRNVQQDGVSATSREPPLKGRTHERPSSLVFDMKADVDEEPLIGAVTPLLRHMHRKKPAIRPRHSTSNIYECPEMPYLLPRQAISLSADPIFLQPHHFGTDSGHDVDNGDSRIERTREDSSSPHKDVLTTITSPPSSPTLKNCSSVGAFTAIDAGSMTAADYLKPMDIDECGLRSSALQSHGKFTLRTVIDDNSTGCWEDLIERYHFSSNNTQLLGEGAYSTVFAAVIKETRQQAAVKRINKRYLFSEAEASCIKREIQHMRTLSNPPHPNIITLLDVIETTQYIYMVLERAIWGTLEDVLFLRRSLPESDARVILHQLMTAVLHVHQKGIVHCDLKPPNILFFRPDTNEGLPLVGSSPDLGSGGSTTTSKTTPFPDPLPFMCTLPELDKAVVKLCDFGHSRACSAYNGIPWNLYQHAGTEGYVAPEILAQQAYGTGVDIWSAGVTLFKIISGWEPFIPCSSCLDRKLELVGACWDGVSNELKGLVHDMLQVDVNLRLSASEVLNHAWFNELRQGDAAL